jgi:hypothetical protein
MLFNPNFLNKIDCQKNVKEENRLLIIIKEFQFVPNKSMADFAKIRKLGGTIVIKSM